MSDQHDQRPFHDIRNITVGRGRILYDSSGGIKDGEWRVPGWVLPGGRRTTSAEEAVAAATWIDAEMSGPVRTGGTG